jgi:O-antigen/teichoic acid export membrane protein
MIAQNSILKNTAYLISGQLIRRFVAFFSSLLIARTLGPEKYGEYMYVITFITISALFWEFGFNTLLTREVSRDIKTASRYTGALVIIKGVLMLVGTLLIGIYLAFAQETENVVWSIVIFGLTSFFNNIIGICYGTFRAFRRHDFSSYIETLRSILLLGLILILFKFSMKVNFVFACYLVSALIAMVFSVVSLVRHFKVVPVFKIDRSFFKYLVLTALPFFMTTAVNIILFRIDHLMLSKMVGNNELGLYSVNYTVFEILISLLPMMIMSSAFPVLADLYKKDIHKMQRLLYILLKYFILISIPMSCGLVILGPEIIALVFGKDYHAGGNILSLLGYGLWVFYLTQLISWSLTAADRQKIVFSSNCTSMIANIALNLYFIPRYGAIGAALTTIASEAIQLIFMGLYLRRVVAIKVGLSWIISVTGTATMAAFIFMVKRWEVFDVFNAVGLFSTILVSIMIYFSIMILLRVFKINELKSMLEY